MEYKKVWFAATDFISMCGPFDTDIDAWKAIKLTDEMAARERRVHQSGARVWPELVQQEVRAQEKSK